MERQEIIKICKKYKIRNYKINNDGSIDVNDSVDLDDKNLTELPLTFNKVTGYFDCDFNNLTTLKGCPRWVGGWFSCSKNKLNSLEFSPDYVGTNFNCSHNNLISLEFGPDYVGSNFYCSKNKLTDNYCDTEIGDNFYTTLEQDGLVFDIYDKIVKATNYKEWRVLQNRKRILDKLFQKDLVE